MNTQPQTTTCKQTQPHTATHKSSQSPYTTTTTCHHTSNNHSHYSPGPILKLHESGHSYDTNTTRKYHQEFHKKPDTQHPLQPRKPQADTRIYSLTPTHTHPRTMRSTHVPRLLDIHTQISPQNPTNLHDTPHMKKSKF